MKRFALGNYIWLLFALSNFRRLWNHNVFHRVAIVKIILLANGENGKLKVKGKKNVFFCTYQLTLNGSQNKYFWLQLRIISNSYYVYHIMEQRSLNCTLFGRDFMIKLITWYVGHYCRKVNHSTMQFSLLLECDTAFLPSCVWHRKCIYRSGPDGKCAALHLGN